jgi:GT2 family glycosyltransferase/glycosyltransferase involved in cell wall biosynthesis
VTSSADVSVAELDRLEREVLRVHAALLAEVGRRPAVAHALAAETTARAAAAVPPDLAAGMADRLAARERHDLQLDLDADDCVAALIARPLPTSAEPVVSIVIPMFNQTIDTLRCLVALAHAPSATPCEIVVVDDGSTEPEVARLRDVPGIRLEPTPENRGFVDACNHGAARARGELVLFLNNDTRVRPGAVDAMVAARRRDPTVGVVGAKLLFPDGAVQEAGGLLFRDGSAANYGRGGTANRPEVSYTRAADFVSGAALLVDRSLFEELGGFAADYAPAYYEDTHLCMAAWDRGRRVVYAHDAEVIHLEGQSYGTGDRDDAKREQMRRNQRIFEGHWRDRLADHPEPTGDLDAVRDRRARLEVLVVDAKMITPDRDAGSLRMAAVLEILQESGAKVVFVPGDHQDRAPYGDALRRSGVEVVAAPHLTTLDRFLAPRGHRFDLVVLSRLDVAGEHVETVRRRCPEATVVFDTVDLHFLREGREARRANDGMAVGPRLTQDLERWTMRHCDTTVVCSRFERELLNRLDPDLDVVEVSLIHREELSAAPLHTRAGLLFVGGFEHTPNADAVHWFVQGSLPLLPPDTTLHVVGSNVPPSVRALATDQVTVHGFVEDLDALYDVARVTIAPLRFGAGVKGKVVQSLMKGIPVVATSVAVEGTPLEPGTHVLVADDAAGFAEAVERLLTDDALWIQLSVRGREIAEDAYGMTSARRQIDDLLTRVGARRLPASV